jgi:tetratricopeptide (TPR) repeat protein
MKTTKLLSTLTMASVILVGLMEVEASEIDSNQTTIANNMSSDKKHAYEQAILLYEKALSFEPNATDILANKGLLLIQLQRYDEAIDVFDKILAIDSNNVDALYNKGVALEKMGLMNDANTYYDKVHEIDPSYNPELINRISESLDIAEAEPSIAGQFENNLTTANNVNKTELSLNESLNSP